MADYREIESALIHGGIFGDELTHSVNTPIYQTSTYQQPELGTNPKWEYSRTGNPTRAALEALIAELEGGGAMISFILKDDYDYRAFFKSLRLIILGESLGGVESLVCHPSTMTHASIPRELRLKVGITDNLIRLSVGLEHIDDLLADLQQAIAASNLD